MAAALLTAAVIRSAPGRCESFQPSCRSPPSAEQEKRGPAAPGRSPRSPGLPFYLPSQDSLQTGNFLGRSFDLLDGNCLPHGNGRAGDGGEDGGAGPPCASSKVLQGPGALRGSERGVTVSLGTLSPSARRGGDTGCRRGVPWGRTHDIGVREAQQDPDLRPHDLFVNLKAEPAGKRRYLRCWVRPLAVQSPPSCSQHPSSVHLGPSGCGNNAQPTALCPPQCPTGAKVLWEQSQAPLPTLQPPPTTHRLLQYLGGVRGARALLLAAVHHRGGSPAGGRRGVRTEEGGPRSPHAPRHALAAQRASPFLCIPLPASFPAFPGKAICIKPDFYRGVKSLSGFSDRTEHPSPHPTPGGDHRDAARVPIPAMSRARRRHTGRSQLQNLPARFKGSPLPRDRSPPPPAVPLGRQGCWIGLITFSDHWTVKSAWCCGPLRGSSAISSWLPGSSEQINSHP